MDTVDPLRFLFAFIFILSLIAVMAFFLKRYVQPRLLGQSAAANADSRLKIMEVKYIDAKRKLVLVRRDNREHLLLLSDGRELVIESNIQHAMMSSPETTETQTVGT